MPLLCRIRPQCSIPAGKEPTGNANWHTPNGTLCGDFVTWPRGSGEAGEQVRPRVEASCIRRRSVVSGRFEDAGVAAIGGPAPASRAIACGTRARKQRRSQHSLGQGEVVSSILTGSTPKCPFVIELLRRGHNVRVRMPESGHHLMGTSMRATVTSNLAPAAQPSPRARTKLCRATPIYKCSARGLAL